MIRRLPEGLVRPLQVAIVSLCVLSFQGSAAASPFGQGVFGAVSAFGSLTALTVALGGNVNLSLLPSGGSTLSGSGSHTLTVTTNDVVGYTLYAYCAGSTNMVNGSFTIPASSNSSAAPLATNTWGYNTSGSTTNFIGMTNLPTLIKTGVGPFESGDNTTVTYGVLTDLSEGSGNYTVNVTYTAVALNY